MNKSINKLYIVYILFLIKLFLFILILIFLNLKSNNMTYFKYLEYSKYLEKLIKLNDKEFTESQYYYAFIDYSSATGFDLYDRLNSKDKEYLFKLAKYILHISTKTIEKGRK